MLLTDDEMLRAIEYAQSGIVSINEAVQCYKIPSTTLKDTETSPDEFFMGPRWVQSLI